LVFNADFDNAIIYSKDFLGHLSRDQSKDYPQEEIKNKKELRQRLESRNLDQHLINVQLDKSKLRNT